MTSRVQTLRSSTTGNTPAAGTRQPGELWLNFADFALGFIDVSRTAQRITAVRYFQTTANYAVGDFVIQGGALYVANVAITAGVFTIGQWNKIALTSDITIGSGAIYPNRIDNGDMSVDQHNNGASVVVPPATLGVITDRWYFSPSQGSKITAGRNYNGLPKCPGFQYYFGLQTTTAVASPAAADFFQQWQTMEADAVGDLMFGTASAQSVTVSFWVCSTLTGAFSGSLYSSLPYRCYIFTYNIPTANTWTKIVLTIQGETANPASWPLTGNGGGMGLQFDHGSGSNFRTATTNQWIAGGTGGISGATGSVSLVSTLNAKWAITGVKLELGSVATPYPVEDLTRKLARCQRYYNVTVVHALAAQSIASSYLAMSAMFPQMRAAPTITNSVLTADVNFTGFTVDNIYLNSCRCQGTSPAVGVASFDRYLYATAEI